MPSTPTTKYGLVTEADGDALVSAAGRFRTLVTTLDGLISGQLSGTGASRPGAGVAGRIYRTTDLVGDVAVDSGSAWLPIGVPRVTSLPTTGLYDGQQVDYVANSTKGVIWRFRYNASGGTYKWEAIGAPAWSEETVASGAVATSSAWVDATINASPSITVPLAGDFLISFYSNMATTGSGPVGTAPKIGAAAVANTDGAITTAQAGGLISLARSDMPRTIAAAATLVKMQHYSSATSTAVDARGLSIKPVRVA